MPAGESAHAVSETIAATEAARTKNLVANVWLRSIHGTTVMPHILCGMERLEG